MVNARKLRSATIPLLVASQAILAPEPLGATTSFHSTSFAALFLWINLGNNLLMAFTACLNVYKRDASSGAPSHLSLERVARGLSECKHGRTASLNNPAIVQLLAHIS